MKKAKLNIKGFIIFTVFPLAFLVISIVGFMSVPSNVNYIEEELISVEFKYYKHFTYSKSIVFRIIAEDGRSFRMSLPFPNIETLTEGDVIQLKTDYYDIKYKEKYNDIYVNPIEIVINGEIVRTIEDSTSRIKKSDNAVYVTSIVFLVLSIIMLVLEVIFFTFTYSIYKCEKKRLENRIIKRNERKQKKER